MGHTESKQWVVNLAGKHISAGFNVIRY